MPDTVLDGDVTIYYAADNNRKQIKWTGAATGTRTCNELYSALFKLLDDPSQMEDQMPLRADTPTIYRIINAYFFDDETVEHLKGGSIYSSGWKSGTTEHILVIGASQATQFSVHDIGRKVLGATTGDTGILLDFNFARKLIWIRPDDPLVGGDEFDNSTESYSIQNSSVAIALQADDSAGPSFVDETTDANSGADGDVTLFPATEATNDYFAVGFAQEFSKLIFDAGGGTAGVGGTVAWEYWNGSAWVAVSGLSDGTTNFTAGATDGQAVTWTAPTDWKTTSLNGSAQLYYIRARITGTYSTNPIYSQVFIAGQGAGAFQIHPRHGAGAKGGESAWAGITSIGAIQANTKPYIFQEDVDEPRGTFRENKVLATKGTDSWWPHEGHLDITLKTKEADSILGPNPDNVNQAIATFFMRQYTKTYSHFVITALATAGGNTVVPFGTDDDLGNTTGHRRFVTDAATGTWNASDIDTVIRLRGANTAVTKAWQVEDTPETYVDETTDANSGADGDVTLFPATEATNDYFAVGYTAQFNKLIFDAGGGTAGVGGVVAWEYWTGTAWTALSGLTDGTTSFTAGTSDGQTVRFTVPTNWAARTINGSDQLYYVRARVTTIYTTNPIYSQVFVVPELDNHAVITNITGSSPVFTVDYYLIRKQTDFLDNDVVEDEAGSKTLTLNGAPSNVGPAVLSVTPTFGATTENINNGNGARPYSIRIDPASNALTAIYERMKYLTRRGSTTALQGQDGEEYVGDELQIEYTAQAGGNFSESRRVYDQTTNAEGVIVADHDDGTTGDVILKAVRGTFTAGNVLSDSPNPTHTLLAALQVEDSPFTIVDETADAISAGGADVLPFPATEAVNDYFAIGAAAPFAKVLIDIATSGVGGVGTWEYWNGTAWSTLETAPNFSDGTSDLTAGTGFQTLVFYPPSDWAPTTIANTTQLFGPYYYIRLRVTTTYSTNPVLDEVQLEDNVTATIGSVRPIVPVAAAPLGTFPGGKYFGAPGLTFTTANLLGGDVQSYQLIDDNGVTQIPPNSVGLTIANLVSGDTVALFRRTGSNINTTQFTLAAGNNQGDTVVDVTATIPSDNPNSPNSKIRLISSSGQHHRYRYDSFATTQFTLSPATTGTADAGSTNTILIDAASNFITDEVEPGDLVRNTTDNRYSRVVSVDSATQLTVEDNGLTWNAKAFSINTLVENYPTSNSAYVPFIERIADATSEAATIIFGSSIDYRAVVRRSGLSSPILPFEADGSITGALTVNAVRTADEIIT